MRLVPSLALACWLLACSSSSDDDLPSIADCTGSGCTDTGKGSSAGGSSGSSGQGGGAGQSGSGGQAGQGPEVSIQGTVYQYTEPTFTTKSLFTLGATVTARPAGSTPATATALTPGTFSLDRVFVGETWLKAQAASDGQQTIGGYRVITTKASNNPDFDAYVVDQQVLVTLLGLLPTPTTLSASAAHAVVAFVDAQNNPVSGVTATSTVNAAAIVGDTGPEYGPNPTGNRGLLLVLNFTATSTATFTYTLPGDPTPVTIPLPNDAATVTFLTIVVP